MQQTPALSDAIQQLAKIRLEDYQRDYIAAMMGAFAGVRNESFARRHGKTQAMQREAVTTTLAGNEASVITVDEVVRWTEWTKLLNEPVLGPEASFDDKRWPGCRIEVWCSKIDKRDPRNPNPKAGPVKRYEVRGESLGLIETFTDLTKAKALAKATHERLVKEAQREAFGGNPLFGRF